MAEKKSTLKKAQTLELNTSRSPLLLPEYGRNIQKMVAYTCTIDDKEKRNRVAQAIITVMGQMYPHYRDIPEFKHKLWDHLFIMSGFQLDVESPYPKPTPQDVQLRPERLKYPASNIKYKHYGKILEMMIDKAAEFKEGPLKDMLVETLANHMKKSFLTWNNKNMVDDSTILDDLEKLSGGSLKLSQSSNLRPSRDIVSRVRKSRSSDEPEQHGRYRRNPGR
ncbi:MAG: DUF4290 domain-containing protein [Bacteroidetes bacterium]|nr:DUF4290 domain-containing protein [Bacteroidota bacterium]